MKSFIFSLTKQDVLPDEMIFYNEGVKITTTKSETLEDLKYLANNGVEIVSCGTCLDFFHLKEELQVGSVTNMYDIVERMEKADKLSSHKDYEQMCYCAWWRRHSDGDNI